MIGLSLVLPWSNRPGATGRSTSTARPDGGNYVVALKANKSLHQDQVKLFFNDVKNDATIAGRCDYHKTVNKDHGRIEICKCGATDELDRLGYPLHGEGPVQRLNAFAQG